MHEWLLKGYEFDNKQAATFYRSNDQWLRGREISLEKYDKEYKAPPLLMKETVIGSEIRDTNQRFVYVYDFAKNWTFHVELIHVSKDENPKIIYPSAVRVEGFPPSQYGTKGLLGEKFADIEEKYDLTKGSEGFGVVGDGDGNEEEEGELGMGGEATTEEGSEEA